MPNSYFCMNGTKNGMNDIYRQNIGQYTLMLVLSRLWHQRHQLFATRRLAHCIYSV